MLMLTNYISTTALIFNFNTKKTCRKQIDFHKSIKKKNKAGSDEVLYTATLLVD